VGLGASGIVACIGEAEGGSPYNGDTPIHAISNPGKVGRTFLDGDLREAGNMLFDPSKDPDVPAGAQQVKFVKANPATRSTLTVQNGVSDVGAFTSRDYGLRTTQINVEIADGTTQGKAVTIRSGDDEEAFDDIGGDPVFTALYTPGTDGADTMTLEVDNASGVDADFTKAETGEDDQYIGTLSGIGGLDGDKDSNIVPGNTVTVVSDNAGDTTQSVIVYGIDNGTGNPTSETLLLTGLAPKVGSTVWASVHGVIKDAATTGNITVSDSGAGTMYVLDAPASLTTGGGVNDFDGTTVETVLNTIALQSDGASVQDVLVIGLDQTSTPTIEEVTLTGTSPVNTTTTWSRIDALAIGYFEAAQSATMTGQLFDEGDVVTVASNNVADTTQTITIYGLDGSGDPQSEVLSLDGTTPVTGTATWNEVHGAVLSALTAGTVSVTGMVGLAGVDDLSIFSWDGSASLYQGFEPVDNVAVSSTALTVVADGATTRPLLLVGLDAAGVAQIEQLDLNGATPVVGTDTWSELTGVVLGHVQAARTVTVSGQAFDLGVSGFATVQEVADRVNTLGGWAITVGANAGTLEVEDMDDAGPSSVLTATEFYADHAFFAQKINDESQLVTYAIEAGAIGLPDNTAAALFLSGGIEGTTTFADWQAALDLLRDEFVNTIVVLTDDAAVHAAVVSHCVYMGGPGRKERDCVLGEESGITFANAKAASVALNTRHARLCIQDVKRFNIAGSEEQFPPYFAACVAAGMQAGSEVGTSLTFKYANVLDVVGDDDTYTIQDDANELIQSGLCVFEKVQGVGFRWLRNITTHLIDNNIAYVEASVNEAVNFAVFNLRTNLEAAIGKKGNAGTVNSVLGIAVATLGQLIDSGAITSWQNLTIELDADVMTVDVEIAPVTPVNFVKLTVHLVTASFSAAA
jgi:hypothetical protein